MSFKSAFTPHSLWRLRRLSCRRQHSVPAGEGGAADARRGVGGEGCAAAALRWAAANAQRCHLVMRDAFAGSVLRRGTRKLRHMLSRCDRVPVCCPESAQRVNDIDPFGRRRELVQRAYSATASDGDKSRRMPPLGSALRTSSFPAALVGMTLIPAEPSERNARCVVASESRNDTLDRYYLTLCRWRLNTTRLCAHPFPYQW